MADETASVLPVDASTFDLDALRGLIQEKTQAEENSLVDVLGVGNSLELQAKILTGSEGLPDYSARRNFTTMVMRALSNLDNPSQEALDEVMEKARKKVESILQK